MGDIELLRSVFRACAGRRIQLLYVAGPAGAEGAADAAGRTGKGIIAHAANDLCRYYAAREGVQTKILRVPFLYTASAALEDPFLVPLFDACSTGSAALQGAQDAAFPLLCAEELSVLVRRIFDSWNGNFETLDVADAFHHTAGEVGEALQGAVPRPLPLPMAILPATPCLPATSLACAMAGFSATTCCATSRPFRRAGMLAAQRRSTPCAPPSTASRCARCPSNAWRRALPGRSLSCWSALFSQSAQLNVLDYRLLYVVLIGTLYGLDFGLVAALLASVGLAASYFTQYGYTFQGLFLRAVQLAAVYCVLCCGCRVRLCAAAQQRSH